MQWIVAPAGLDAQLKTEFGSLVTQARDHELDSWAAEAEGSLALVVLLDQFFRNIYRGTPSAFAADDHAWHIATQAVGHGFDKQVSVIQASAFYFPIMQRESFISVIAARGLWEGLRSRCEGEEESKWVGLGIMGVENHMEQLERFGRFPTRNELLGRESTEEERGYLDEHVAKRVAEMKKAAA